MACFLIPAAEAAILTVATKIIEKKEKTMTPSKAIVSFDGKTVEEVQKIPFSRKLKWLTNLQWGGAVLLAFEHIWHGEIVAWFPFLSAMSDKGDAAEMLHEMATVGIAMAALTSVVWLIMLAVAALIEKRAQKEAKSVSETK